MAGFRSPLPLPLGIAVDQTGTPTVGFHSLFWWMAGLDGGFVASTADSMIDWRRRRRMRRLNIRNP